MASGEMIYITRAEYQELLRYKSEVEWLKHQLAELKRLVFGAKSERFIAPDPAQGTLFDLPEATVPERQVEEIAYTRTKPGKHEKKHPLRAELPAHLPRKVEVIEPGNLPEGAKKIGEAVTEVLEYEPASIYVRQIVRPKYIVEDNDEATRVEVAELPAMPVPKGNAGPSMVAHILVSKFADHQPYYRQSQIFKRQNLNIPDSTIGGWANKTIGSWLSPLWEAMKAKLLSSGYIGADETPIQVLTGEKEGSSHRGYHWVYYDPVNKLAVFDYRPSREREGPRNFLKGFTGYLQSDGYAGYGNLGPPGKITHLACMAHARRKFEHALGNDPARAGEALKMFQSLYQTEREAKEAGLPYGGIKQLRQEKSVPVLEGMERWLVEESLKALPKSAIGMAINYTLNLWGRLKRYVEDGRFQIDNNLVENAIRPVALGRKNYLFAGSHVAAQNAAVVYSLLATCKLHEVEPFNWLKNTLAIIPDCPSTQLGKLLPGYKE